MTQRTLAIVALLLLVRLPVWADHVSQDAITPDVPRDAIPPLDAPRYDAVAHARWGENDWVLVYTHDGDARAYPVNIMNWHEIVNDTVGGLEVLVSYCPLCRSGLVFDRRLRAAAVPEESRGALPPDTVLDFGNTGALYESDMVLYDRQSDSQWFQVGGEALIGPLHGVRLRRLPSQMMTWSRFKALYPEGRVLARATGYERARDYEHDNFARYAQNHDSLYFGVSRIDPRLPTKTVVLGLEFGTERKAYDVAALGDGAHPDVLGGRPLIVFIQDGAGAAFSPELAGRRLTFSVGAKDFIDAQTGSRWDLTGRARQGPLAGQALELLPQATLYWFSWAAYAPSTLLAPKPDGLTPYSVEAPAAMPTWPWALGVGLILIGVGAWWHRRFGKA